jgi:Bacteriophage head to tail connecting protein
MKIDSTLHGKWQSLLKGMKTVRTPWEQTWRELSDYFLPRRYFWLLTDKEQRSASIRNRQLLDSTSILALRTLSTGMMNGITSPARPWFRLTRPNINSDEQLAYDEAIWLEAAGRKMLYLMAQSNFYNAMGIMYLEWPTFGTAAMSIYEDPEYLFRCHNFAIGEFFIACDGNGEVIHLGREFSMTSEALVKEYGAENCSLNVQADVKERGARLMNQQSIYHLCTVNDGSVRKSAPFMDIYWEASQTGTILRKTPLDEWPNIVPRWEVYANDYYGSSPCMDALPDVMQLQHMIKRRAQGLDKVVNPPMLYNQMLAGRPRSTLPGGETFFPGSELDQGARPVYQINIPFQELNMDIQATKVAIREVLYNPLFTMISDLSTVRSATEIDARKEEKLVLLGPVRDRFENEALTPAIQRIFSICRRRGAFGIEPPSLQGIELQVRYTSLLSDAQRAVGTSVIERYLQLLGNMAPIFQDDTLSVPNPEEIIREYADAIGLPTKLQKSRQEVQMAREAQQQQRSIQEAAQTGAALVGGAQQLSQTDLGGGTNALQALLG